MKKFISVLLVLAMLCSALVTFAACKKSDDNEGDTSKKEEVSKKVKVINLPLSEEEYAFAIAKDNTDLLEKMNTFLAKIKSNGKYDSITNNYYGDGTPLKIKSAALDESKDQLVVATSTGFEPFEMLEGDNFSGVDLEIAYYFAEEYNMELVIKDMDFDAVVNSVQSGICDIGMAGLSVTPARQEVVTFSNSYHNASQVLICMESDKTFDACKTGEDVAAILKGLDKSKKIGCQEGTTGKLYIIGDEDYGFEGLAAECLSYKYGALAFTAMIQGNVNYVILDNGPANIIAAKTNGN